MSTDGALRRRQSYLLAGRLIVALLLLGGSLAVSSGEEYGEFTQDALMALMVGTFALSLGVAIALPRTHRPERLASIQLAWDLGLVTGIVYLLGGAASGFSFLYGVVILAAALVASPRATQLVTGASLVAYLAVSLALANDWIAAPPDRPPNAHVLDQGEFAFALLRNLVGFVLVGLLAGSLSERLQRTGTELERVSESAAEYARFNDDILRSMSSGVLTTDLDGRVRILNPAGAAMLGGDATSFVGRIASELLPLGDQHTIERGEGVAVRRDGTRFPIGYSSSPLRDASGAHLGRLVVFQDLTELDALREKAERAERLAALGRLAAGLAHEIRNPLGSISGSVEMVREAPALDEEDRHLLTLVLGEVDRLNDLVTTMLDIGRPREPEPTSVDLTSLAKEVANVAERDPGPPVRVVASEKAVLITADHAQLRQVLWNLVKNARQYSPRDREVRVEVGWDAPNRARVSIADEGPGIADEDRAHLFDMFYTKRRHGVGLGLALARQIVEAHHGEITVESEPGRGAVFTVYLPAEPPRTDSSNA